MSAGDVWIAYDGERFIEVERTDETVPGFHEREPAEVRLHPEKGGEPKWWGPRMRQERGIYEKCIDCDEGRQTSPGRRCRECDIGGLCGRSPCP